MAPEVPALIVVVLVASSLLVSYWLIRLAVRHGSLDARRRWRDQEDQVQAQLNSEGYPER